MDFKSTAITVLTIVMVLFILGMVKMGSEKKSLLDMVAGK